MKTKTISDSVTAHPTSYDTSHYSYGSVSSSYPISNAYTASSSTTYGQVTWKTGSNAETYVYLRFDFSEIPDGATIKSVTAKAKGYVNTTNSSRVTARQMQLATGTTLKGSALTLSTSTSEQTFSNVGTWTRAELMDAGVRYYVKRGTSNTSSTYNLRMYGATMTVTYEYESVIYEITVNNNSSAVVEADPDEVDAGGTSTIKADTLENIIVTDNGVDVTNRFVQRQESPESYTVTNVGTYGFALNSNSYYQSNNRGVSKTAAVCRVDFHLPVSATITFSFINYAEEEYDFGVFGNIDETLSDDYYPAGNSGATITDSSYRLACNTSSYNSSSVRTLTYNMDAGDHYIYVKYSKDDASDANNDTLQFKVAITLDETPSYDVFWAYDITNVSGDHLIVVNAVGGVKLYYKLNGTWIEISEAYKKVNGVWVKQTDLSAVFDPNTNYVKG